MSDLNSLSQLATIGSGIATVLAMGAAFQSAASAKLAQQDLQELQLRVGRRDVATLVTDCVSELRRIHYLAHTLRIISTANASFTGNVNSSRQKLMTEGVSSRVVEAENLCKAVAPFTGNPRIIANLVQVDIDRLQLDFVARLATLRVITEELARDSASQEAQLLQFRENAMLKGTK